MSILVRFAPQIFSDFSGKLIVDQEQEIKCITETESLAVEQIQELSLHSAQYIIPHKQKNNKRYGLVLFSSEDRDGAWAEADDLEHALEVAGCDVIKMEWKEGSVLRCRIAEALSSMVNDCSLLIVCLMSHGSSGVLRGRRDGEEILVNDILKHFSTSLSKDIPLVRSVISKTGSE